MSDDIPSLFELGADPAKPPGRRNPKRQAASRLEAMQTRLPIFGQAAEELLKLEDLGDEHRPVTRGECEEEARPCPWVRCPNHIYFERFIEFETVIDAIPESGSDADVPTAVSTGLLSLYQPEPGEVDPAARRPRTTEGVVAAVSGGRAMFTAVRRGAVRSDVVTSDDVQGPWPTCMLDVASQIKDAGSELSGEDTARVLGITREGVRLIEDRAAPYFAQDQVLRPWLLEIVDEERLDDVASRLDWFGDED